MNLDLLVPLTGILAGTALLFPLIRALVLHIERRSSASLSAQERDALRGELESMRRRLEEMERVGDRVADLEERIDFTERVLLQQREAARLPKGE